MNNNEQKLTIAVDGPGGAGKSSLARALARQLGISYVDTGALYRTVGYAVRCAGADPDDRAAVVSLLHGMSVEAKFENGRQDMYLNGEFLGEKIRENDISHYASTVSAHPEVREFLLGMQRDIAANNSVVMDGRDIGTVIMPDATVKIFLSASPQDRAERRYLELRAKGKEVDYETVYAEIVARDARDSGREVAPLRPADDAILLDNSGFEPQMTVDAAMEIVRDRLAQLGRGLPGGASGQ